MSNFSFDRSVAILSIGVIGVPLDLCSKVERSVATKLDVVDGPCLTYVLIPVSGIDNSRKSLNFIFQMCTV